MSQKYYWFYIGCNKTTIRILIQEFVNKISMKTSATLFI